MGMALSGLASGFDWKSIVDQLIEVSRAPQNRMRTEKSTNASKTSALNEIKGLLASLKTSAGSLAAGDALLKKSATFKSSTTSWTAAATKDTPTGEYIFKIKSPATASKLQGVSGIAKQLDPDAPISGQFLGRTLVGGTLTINGKQITISTTDSLSGDPDITGIPAILKKISDAGAGVTASYDIDSDTIKLVSDSGGRISLGASNDTSNFFQVMRLKSGMSEVVNSAPKLSAVSLSKPIDQANLASWTDSVVSDGSFKINGVPITYDSASNSLQEIISQINASDAGVTASYDLAAGGFVLTNKTTGSVGISITDDSHGLAAAMGLTTVNPADQPKLGSDAVFTLNGGGDLTSRSNILDETAHGIKGLSVTVNSTVDFTAPGANDTQTLTVAGDNTAAKDSLNDFITKYNAVQNAIEKYTKITVSGDKVSSAILAGNRELSVLSRSLRTALYQSGTGITGTVKRLSDLGINFAGIEPTISLSNSSVLDSKLSTATDDISEFLQGNTSNADQGLIDRLDKILSSYVSDSGTAAGGVKAQLDSITKQNKSLDKQIEDVERRLASQRSLLESSFIAMERAQSGFQQQSSYLAKTFNNSK
jgi:flagellar hook-associated protein 2